MHVAHVYENKHVVSIMSAVSKQVNEISGYLSSIN